MKRWSGLVEWEKVCILNVTGRRAAFPQACARQSSCASCSMSDTGLKQEWKHPETEEVTAQRRQLSLSCKNSQNNERFPSAHPDISVTVWRREAGPSSLGLCFIFSCCRWANSQTFVFTTEHLSQELRQERFNIWNLLFYYIYMIFINKYRSQHTSIWFQQLNSLKKKKRRPEQVYCRKRQIEEERSSWVFRGQRPSALILPPPWVFDARQLLTWWSSGSWRGSDSLRSALRANIWLWE